MQPAAAFLQCYLPAILYSLGLVTFNFGATGKELLLSLPILLLSMWIQMKHPLTRVELLPGGCLQFQHGGDFTLITYLSGHAAVQPTAVKRVEQSHKGNRAGVETGDPGFILYEITDFTHLCLLDWGALKYKVGRGTWNKCSWSWLQSYRQHYQLISV